MVTACGSSMTTTVLEQPATEEVKVVQMQLKPKQNVQWTEDTIDNEFMNKKKSKICCIYEKPKTHPDDTSSSSSCSSDDDRACNNYDRYPRHQRKAMRQKEQKKASDDAPAEQQ
mmetsp:Transcript_5216/g.6390  ORF Transcript_5216/g.6390 Transcript_5216/m.6390 type:complete len:114 (-) Transcript_5216:1128-1469(-)